MKYYSISTIKRKVKELGKKINAPKEKLQVYSQPPGFGDPHIGVDKNGYHYVIWEKGNGSLFLNSSFFRSFCQQKIPLYIPQES